MTETPPPPEPSEHAALQRKAISGVATLAARSVVIQLLVFAGNLILARILDPRDFGVFSISQFALTFFVFFGDAGLAGALVQQHQTPSNRMLSSVFWLQLLISVAVIAVVWVTSPLSHLLWRDLPSGSEWLLRALSFELLLTAARTVPSLLMERKLSFGRLSALEVTNQLAFYAAALPLAFAGRGVWALVAGVLTRATSGVILAYILRPWRPEAVLDWTALRPILRFGVAYQARNLVGFVSSALVPVYAGHVLGVRAVGLIGWSRTLAYTPLKLVEIMSRVGFPLYSRLQHDRSALGKALGKSIHVCAAGAFVFTGVVFGLAPQVVRIAYPKWIEAVPLLYLFAGSLTLGFLSPVISAAFDATGKPQVFLRLSVIWTVLGWCVVPFTTARWGAVGFVAGFLTQVVFGNLMAIRLARDEFPTARTLDRMKGVAIAMVVQVVVTRFGLSRLVVGPVTLVLAAAGAVVCFGVVVLIVDRAAIADALTILRRNRGAPA